MRPSTSGGGPASTPPRCDMLCPATDPAPAAADRALVDVGASCVSAPSTATSTSDKSVAVDMRARRMTVPTLVMV